jgi:Cys-rich four helix bundle protein (predicted Tat secretion target)
MNRRELIVNASAIAGTLATSAMAFGKNKDPHAGHKMDEKSLSLYEAAMNCQTTGQQCLEHSILMMSQGQTNMLKCVNGVRDMLAVTETLAKLASSNSPHIRSYATVAAQVCSATEKLCREHAKDHAECAKCADSCKKTAEVCGQTVASLSPDAAKG